MENIALLTDDVLLSRIDQTLGNERQLLVRFLGYLGEVEERRVDLKAGFESLFDFCTTKLRLSEGQAYRRILGARYARRYPVLNELLENGAMHLSKLELLRPYLNEENHAELLAAASFKKKSEVKELLACRFSKPDEPSSIRKVPERPSNRRATEPSYERGASRATEGTTDSQELRLEPPSPGRDSGIDPLSAGRYRVRLTASGKLKNKLERAANLMSHSNPSFDLSVVVERAVDLLLEELERTKLGKTHQPRKARKAKHGAVTQAARRAATERDGEQCAYVDPKTGRRCTARRFLELDHIDPRALGGGAEPGELRWCCARHNRLHAEQTFGREHIDEAIHLRRQRRQKCRRPKAVPLSETQAKVVKALANMGFRATDARVAVEQVAGSEPEAEPALESMLRTALRVLTDARAPSG